MIVFLYSIGNVTSIVNSNENLKQLQLLKNCFLMIWARDFQPN